MNEEFWQSKWDQGQIGFHADQVHPDLTTHSKTWLGTRKHRILVPLCGKTHDLAHLALTGHEVVGIELIRSAVEAWADDLDREVGVQEIDGIPVFRVGTITVLVADIFTVPRSLVGAITAVWDRAANVALPPEMRVRYTARIKELAPGSTMLLNTFEYNEGFIPGPPFSVPATETAAAYGEENLSTLSTVDMTEMSPWKERGAKRIVSTTRLVKL